MQETLNRWTRPLNIGETTKCAPTSLPGYRGFQVEGLLGLQGTVRPGVSIGENVQNALQLPVQRILQISRKDRLSDRHGGIHSMLRNLDVGQ